MKSKNDEKVKILPKSDMSQFLHDCADAEMVISVDTGALHFREGIGKPAIGIYNAFTSDCRTRYYKYVKTIDIKSDCSYQPCFLHVQQPNDPCFNDKYCLNMNDNKTLIKQLNGFFWDNLFRF